MSGRILDWGWDWRDIAFRNMRLFCVPLQTARKCHCFGQPVLTHDCAWTDECYNGIHCLVLWAGRHLGQESNSLHYLHAQAAPADTQAWSLHQILATIHVQIPYHLLWTQEPS